jgi:carbamoyltransferase
LRDGEVIAAVEEERFTRQKHTSDFPRQGVAWCLERAGIGIGKVDWVAFYERPRLKFNRIISTHLRYFPRTFQQFARFAPIWLGRNMQMERHIREELGFNGRIHFVEHHAAHAASAYLPSGFDRAAILTVDGVGEWTTTTRGRGEGCGLRLEEEIRFPHSLGLLYSAVTSYLGFQVNSGEGKVMGLASYGKPRYREQFDKLLHMRPDGSFRLDMDYFDFHLGLEMFNSRFDELFGCRRMPGEEIRPEHEDIAASLQDALEGAMLAMARDWHDKTGLDALCIGGGVGLNSVANGRILRESGFRDIFVQPACSDAGAALGAALYVWSCILGRKERWRMTHACLGHEAGSREVEEYLEKEGIPHQKLSGDEIAPRVAHLLAQDKIVGWYQGRMEFGPRALGSRSILANPCNPEMKDILNSRVKFREPFRPYAAAVMEEHLGEYFDCAYPSPFMLLVYNVLEGMRAAVPAVTHVDGTCRVQSVRGEQNPLLYRLIEEFRRLKGIAMILNTSFNVRGEPIVRDVKDAVNCYIHTGMDALAACNCLLTKEPGEER